MTSAGGELGISPDKIKTHATNVPSAGSGLTQALEAAQAVSAPSDTFGNTSSNPTVVADAFTTRDTTNAAALKTQQAGL